MNKDINSIFSLYTEAGVNPVEQQLQQANNPKAAAKTAFNQKWNNRLNQMTQTARTAQNQITQGNTPTDTPCPNCGATGFGGKKFCGKCGADMATGETAEQRAERNGTDLEGKPVNQQQGQDDLGKAIDDHADNMEKQITSKVLNQQQQQQQPAQQQQAPAAPAAQASAPADMNAKVQKFGKELTAFQSMFEDLMKQFEELKK